VKEEFMSQAVSSPRSVIPAQRVSTLADRKRQDAIVGYTFIAPAFIILFVFLIVPILAAVYFSTTNWDGITPLTRPDAYELVGLRNYERLLLEEGIRQESFYTSLKNTVYFVLGVVPTQTFLALILAVILNQRWLKAKGFFRTAFYFPSITSSVVISLIFMFMFTNQGLVNTAIGAIFPNYQRVTWLNDPNGVIHNLLAVFGITRDTVGDWANNELASIRLWDWISGPSVTMLMIMILNTWTTIGTMMVIYLAALQNIPGQVYEAATVDGASAWQIFRKITVPLLRPTTFFVITIGLIGAFQVFDQIFVISNGGPDDTTLTIAYLVYSSGFTDTRMGQAAATAIILFVIIFIFTMIQRRFVGDKNV
jgi:multiple sugar transport system permease protein